LAYVIPLLDTEPTEEEVAGLVDVTEQFWDEFFEQFYDGTGIMYRGIELVVDGAFFNAGIPDERFDYYINFNTTVLYEDNPLTLPNPIETFEIMASADFGDYVRRFVRTQPAFNSASEVVFRAQESSDVPTMISTPTDSIDRPIRPTSGFFRGGGMARRMSRNRHDGRGRSMKSKHKKSKTMKNKKSMKGRKDKKHKKSGKSGKGGKGGKGLGKGLGKGRGLSSRYSNWDQRARTRKLRVGVSGLPVVIR
jgi:hypothetical protein